MPRFCVEQYELHVTKYIVEAASAMEAVEQVYAGNVDPPEDGSKYLEVADGYGMPVAEHRELAAAMRATPAQYLVGRDVIHGLRNVCEVSD